MSYTTEVKVEGLDINNNRVQVSGWNGTRKGYSVISLPSDMPTPKLGDKLQITVEVQP